MLRAVYRTWVQWRLRKARERYAYWKAYHDQLEAMMKCDYVAKTDGNRRNLVVSAAKVAQYEERVETLHRANS